MEQEEKDRLLQYSMKMIERGDRFSDILLYLDRKGADNELSKEILAKLEEHRKLLENRKEQKKLYPVSYAKIVFGTLFFGLTLYLQYLGLIGFPWTLLGFLAAIGALIELVKIIINTSRK
ncbi:MAG: hypothetical protein LBD76_03540 [Prevotellaceae bacterium]|jgi:hypothetical protein|nr:hypothetical protein [Prevotellaceae bacterium]